MPSLSCSSPWASTCFAKVLRRGKFFIASFTIFWPAARLLVAIFLNSASDIFEMMGVLMGCLFSYISRRMSVACLG